MSERLEKAILFAIEAHGGQMYGDAPYATHPLRVMAAVANTAKVVAVLHDVFEDTEAPFPDWLTMDEYNALHLLTRRGTTYREYIHRIAVAEGRAGELAREVKIADLRDNIGHGPGGSLLKRYTEALAILTPQGSEP